MLSLLAAVLSLAATIAQVEKKPDEYCAKIALSSIYAAEKSHFSEFDFYSDSFQAIGYEPLKEKRCEGWKSEIRIFNGGKEFLAECSHTSGKRFTINDKKELKEE